MQTLIQKRKNILTVAMVAALSVSTPPARALEKESTTKPARAEFPQLQLTVQVPPHWRPFLSDDLAEAFASRFSDVFRRRGYAGEVQFLNNDDPKTDSALLAIRLINWRIGHADHAECSFTATLSRANQEHELGLFENTSLVAAHHVNHLGPADALGEVADAALRDLSTQLGQAGLLPGFQNGNT